MLRREGFVSAVATHVFGVRRVQENKQNLGNAETVKNLQDRWTRAHLLPSVVSGPGCPLRAIDIECLKTHPLVFSRVHAVCRSA